MVLPETVMHAVDADFDELKIVPFQGGHQIADHLKMLPRHIVNLVAEPLFVVGAEAFDVYRILPYQVVDLLPYAGRVGIIVRLRVRGHEASDIDAIHASRGIAGRHSDNHHILVVCSQYVPDGRLLNGTGVHYGETVVRIIFAVAKSVYAQGSQDPGWWTCTSRPAR
jgi:hypothetical protein